MTHRTVVTFGTHVVFHVGHLRLLRRAAALGDRLVVGVSADALNVAKKGRADLQPGGADGDRRRAEGRGRGLPGGEPGAQGGVPASPRCRRPGDGHDWKGRFDGFSDVVVVVYFPRTPSVSTTEVIEHIATGGAGT